MNYYKSPLINDNTNDITLENGDIKLVSGIDELIQEVKTVIKTNVHEWFLDPTHGFDYTTVWRKKPTDEEITQALFNAIEQIERIDRIENIRIDFDRRERTLSVFFVAVAINGERVEGSEVL